MNQVNNFDLNLLRVFGAVHAEGHIGRAAKRLGITQPAVSHAIQRHGDKVGTEKCRVRSPSGRAAVLAP